jgi:hypothetical protein
VNVGSFDIRHFGRHFCGCVVFGEVLCGYNGGTDTNKD